MKQWFFTLIAVTSLAAQDCPVTINHYRATDDLVQINWKNVAPKPITSIRFQAYSLTVGDRQPLATKFDDNLPNAIKPGQSTFGRWTDYESKARTGGAWVEKVVFSDGSQWQDNGSNSCRFERTK
jgi:hypothetical protein